MTVPAWAQYDGLIISEVVDGTNSGVDDDSVGYGGVPKYIELYNAATYEISLANLVIRRYANGKSAFAQLPLGSVTLAKGEAYIAASSSTSPRWPFETSPDTADFFVINANGNDVYELYDTTSQRTVDIYGVIGTNGTGELWEFTDKRVVRKPEFNIGKGKSFNVDEWEIEPYTNAGATPGSHVAIPLGPLPVELISFEALADGGSATLSWTTASEENNTGFHIEHRRASATTDQAAFQALGFVSGHGTTSEAHAYRFQTAELEVGRHVFRLRQVDFDGTVSYSGEVELEVASEMPEGFRLSAAYPNPFNPRTQFTLSVRETQEVRVEVFNLLGQRVRLLHEGPLEASREHSFTFEAGDLPSGLYLCRAQGETFVSSEQVTLLK